MDLSTVHPELQALADHWATTHHLPALVWGVMLDGQLTMSGHSGQLDDGSSPTTRQRVPHRLDDEAVQRGDGATPA